MQVPSEEQVAAVGELIALARSFREASPEAILAAERKLENVCRTLLYHCRYGARSAAPSDPLRDHSVLHGLRCSVAACQGFPLYNVAFARGAVEFRCLAHIPPEITFPVSLWGTDYEVTGRRLPTR